MATTEFEKPEVPRLSPARRVEQAVGADRDFTIRLMLSILLVGVCVGMAPLPFNIFGGLAVLVMVFDITRIIWKRK